MSLLEGNDVLILKSLKTDWSKDCNRSIDVNQYLQSRDAFPTAQKNGYTVDDVAIVDYSIGLESGERFQVQTAINFAYASKTGEDSIDYAFQVRMKGKNAQNLLDQLKSEFSYLSE